VTTTPTAKTCIRCRTDCSGRARIRDGNGRYICRRCLRPEELAKVDGGLPQPVAPIPVAAPVPDDPAGFDPLPFEIPEAPAGLAVCPQCQSSIPYGSSLCIQCGYDTAKGKHISTTLGIDEPDTPKGSPASGKCVKCGYTLKGLKSPRCPECGHLSTPNDIKERMRATSRQTARWAYLKPLIHFGIGILILSFIAAASDAPSGVAILYGVKLAIGVPIGVLAFFLCCLIWMGFDAPMHLTAIRLAGVYALTDAAAALLSFVPIPLIPWLITLALYVGLLAESLELDLQDAILVGLVTWFIKFMALMFLLAWLLSQQ
jgi:hypothetical protein